jgi:archaellum component FlaC
MTLIATANTTDPFGDSLQNLKTTLQDFGPLVEPIDELKTIVTDIDNLLISIGDLITAANDIDSIILILGDVLDFLDPIPIVGEIAGVISGAVETAGSALKDALTVAEDLNKETIQPVIDVLNDVKKGLQDIRVVVVDISQKVPGYINTIETLHYLSEIAEPVVKVLKGTDAADKLYEILKTFNEVQEDLGKALDVFTPVLKTADKGVKEFTTALDAIKKVMGSDVEDVLGALNSAAKALTPISNGFHRMEDSIKPLAWVLDALSCIFNKILKPVIDAIMHATHLDDLVKSAEDEIFKKLGISGVIDLSNNNINKDDLSSIGSSTGSSTGEDSSRLWDAVETALGQYSSGQGGTKTAILSLVSAITNTEIDPGKPSQSPPFPPMSPDLTPAKTPASSELKASIIYKPRLINQIDTDIVNNIENPPSVRFYSKSIFGMAVKGNDPSPLPKIDPTVWPNSAKLIDSISTLCTGLDSLAPSAAKFEGSIYHFEKSLSLPATFTQQVSDLSSLLTDSVNILDFLETLKVKFVAELVKPFDDVAHDQNTKMKAVINELPDLNTAMANLDSASKDVIASIPKTKVIDDVIHRIEGWSMSITQIIQLVIEARTNDATEGNKRKAEIDAFAEKLEAIAASISDKVDNISSESDTLNSAISAIQLGLDSYTTTLKNISDHSTLISSKVLPVADKAVHILGIVNSIIDPLSNLLQAENCIDASNPMKIFAATAIDTINTVGEDAAKAQPELFVEFAEGLAEAVLPLTQLAADVQKATSSINDNTVDAFDKQSANLVNGLKQLNDDLVQSKSYTTTIKTREGGTKTITINNDLINQDLLDEANKIIDSFNIPQ